MRRERRHHTAPTLRARAAGRREAEGAHAGGLLRVPPPIEPQRERLGLRDLQSNRRNATALSVVRSSESPRTCAGAPLAAASARNRAAESGLTPSRASVSGSAEASDGSACPRQRPCSAPNTNSRFRTMGPPIPPLSWFWVYPCPNGDALACPQASERSRSVWVNDPCGMFLPLRVVEATRPPENWPRAAS